MATCVHVPEVLEQNFWHLLYLNQHWCTLYNPQPSWPHLSGFYPGQPSLIPCPEPGRWWVAGTVAWLHHKSERSGSWKHQGKRPFFPTFSNHWFFLLPWFGFASVSLPHLRAEDPGLLYWALDAMPWWENKGSCRGTHGPIKKLYQHISTYTCSHL